MRVRRLFSTSLSLIVLVTQLAMPISQAFASAPSAPASPAGPDSQPPPTREQIVIPVTETVAPVKAVDKPPDAVPPVTIASPPASAAPRAVRSVPLGTGNSNYGQTQRETDNPQNHPGHHFAGSVNVLNGNFFLTVGDFFIPGRGLSLQLARSYNSLGATNGDLNGAFGPGWTHSYETQVISETGGVTVTVQEADGALHHYTEKVLCPEGTCYQSPSGLYRQLQVLPGGLGYVLRYKNGTVQIFDERGRLLEIRDRHDNMVLLQYGSCDSTAETLCQVLGPAGRSLDFRYSDDVAPEPRIIEISESVPDGSGRTILYGYDGNGRLVDVAYPERMTTSALTYEYDDWNRMIAYDDIRQPAGVRHADDIAYDAEDRVITVTYDSFFDVFVALDYAPSSDYLSTPAQNPDYPPQNPVGAVEFNDGAGQITRVEYDAYGNITYEGDWFPEFGWWWGKWWWWHPIDWWLLERKVDANKNVTEYAYDTSGNTAVITNALGATQRFLWEQPYYEALFTSDLAYGNVLSATNSLNVTTLYEYDYAAPDGWMMTEIQAAGTADQSATIYEHDVHGQLVRQTDNAGQETTYGYDEFGNTTLITDARGYVSRNDYDMLGRPISTTTPAGQITVHEYDLADRLVRVTDAEEGTTQYTYSADGRDNLVQLVNANGVTTTYQYDNLDRLSQQTDSLGQITTYQYDQVGRLVERNDADGRRTTYTYDAKSRMTQAEYYAADAVEPYQTNTYHYDGVGNLIRMANADVRMAFQYDAINQRTQIDMRVPSWPTTRTLQLEREPEAGNLTQVLGPGDYAVQYTYDALNRVDSVTAPAVGQSIYQYDEAGRLTYTQHPDGSVSTYGYNATNHLTDVSHQLSDTVRLPYTYTYAYDGQGNVTGEIDRGQVYSYTYDRVDRLIASEGGEQGEVTFEYDAVGNRLSASGPISATQYTYDAHNRLVAADNASFTYNNMGARTQAQFNADATRANVMASPQSASGALVIAQAAQASETVTYTYDNDMRLTQVGPDTHLIYDPLGNLIGVVESNGQARYYLRDGKDVYLELDENGDVLAQYVLDGEGVLGMWREGRWHLFLYDGRGRVRHVVDLTTGELITHYGTDLSDLGGYPYFYNPIRMRGAWWLPTLGLIHFGEGVFWDPWFGTYLIKAWPWLYWPFGPFHPWRPVFRFWPWPWPWARPWGWPWPRPWPFLWPWPGAWVRPWVIWPFWPWGLRPWWPWWYWRAWWGWHWWGHWWCWHPWWWFCKWWWWPWWHPWWWWGYWWWPWWWWSSCWWWPSYWWWWPRWWWPWWWGGRFWWCWWWWWPWPGWIWWPWRWPPTLGPPEVGDAPDRPYDSFRRNQGAIHGIWWYEWLGAWRDGEWDSQQVDADRHDDGVALNPYNSMLIFTPTVSSPWSARYSAWHPLNVHGWADWNSDGDWDDANEWIANWSGYPGGGTWPAGQSSLGVTQPFNGANVQFGAGDLARVWLRFRLNYADSHPPSPRGYTRFGEVEDHVLTIARPATPSWDGRLDLPPDYGPLTINYPLSVQGVSVSIVPTVGITPTWSDGPDRGDQVTIAHAPFTVGRRYTVTLSNGALYANTGMALADQFSFKVAAVKPSSVTVSGPASGVVNSTYTFTATALPTTATLPFTYTWQTTGPSRTWTDRNAGRTSAVSFTWSISGMQHITVTARNAGGQVVGYDSIHITPQTFKPTSVTVSGPASGVVSDTYTFTATSLPGTASLPLTFIWQATGPSRIVTDSNTGRTSVVSFTWFISGMQYITVTARNAAGQAVGYDSIDIQPRAVIWYYVYLPLTLKGP